MLFLTILTGRFYLNSSTVGLSLAKIRLLGWVEGMFGLNPTILSSFLSIFFDLNEKLHEYEIIQTDKSQWESMNSSCSEIISVRFDLHEIASSE